ncbi:tRNA dihydrouridine synthase DusB [Mesoterricola sediminis]|uniref:tRNA-dihydrouridine synthase n=1 Tax=Mesoterricola sediminis TaxID=2927980 RepID=A0AA48GSI9_9BACT|nr:tRNA dihydrouridine synthase DusB [Mesoterricola sediminis]BDU76797.1 tRNA-dihydrouridine synthase [Mesoterricola sediminis]
MTFPHSSFSIGPHVIQPPLVMAPLHEITDQPFRRMIRQVGGVGLTVSEMISSEALIRHARKAERMMAGEGERPFAMQLAGSVPEHLGEAAALAQAAGADIVDINMGCPASNVTRGGAGSALLRDIRLAEAVVKAVVKAVDVPVTVKMRAGWDNSQKERADYLDFLRMFEANGVRALAIHPRTRAQQYEGHADWSLIARAVEAGTAFPIIGNGDVNTPEDAFRMVAETGCHGVMVGRAALTNPWIFRQILEPGLQVTELQRIELCLDFMRLLQDLLEPREALHKMKKIGGWFTKGIPGGSAFRQNLHEISAPEEILEKLEALRSRAR